MIDTEYEYRRVAQFVVEDIVMPLPTDGTLSSEDFPQMQNLYFPFAEIGGGLSTVRGNKQYAFRQINTGCRG